MQAKPPERVNKSECCRLMGWTRYQFDLNVTAGMPVAEPARSKGGEWKVDLRSVRRWVAKREAEEAARRRRLQAYLEGQRREAERLAQARWEREQQRERARRAAERAQEEAWRREREARERGQRLDRAYRVCWALAYEDYGSPKGAFFPNGRPRFAHEDHPGFMADWPFARPAWWLPPPGMLAAIAAEPAVLPYGYRELDWRRWWPGYVLGRRWPWRTADASTPEPDADGPGATPDSVPPQTRGERR
jgi:phage terminase Nu1 subunit (DNA packaging protein)